MRNTETRWTGTPRESLSRAGNSCTTTHSTSWRVCQFRRLSLTFHSLRLTAPSLKIRINLYTTAHPPSNSPLPQIPVTPSHHGAEMSHRARSHQILYHY